jgi:ABC-type glycerol-3-phosphate transport system substrate-binding protein
MTRSVTDGRGTTHFFEVFNGKTIIGRAMVFVPTAVSMVESAPMIVYYHGHNSQDSIEGYIKAMKQRDFRPFLNSKRAVLVEPWGGTNSKFGAMATGSGLTTLIDSAMFTAISYGKPSRPCPVKPPPPKSLILAGFSGGGAALNAAVNSDSPYLSRMKEAWAFDCLYSEEGEKWVNWAKANGGKRLRVRVTTVENTGSPRRENKIIQATPLPNVDVADPVSIGHEDCPGAFIPNWL